MTEVWRLLLDERVPGVRNMALDRAIQLSVESGDAPPTVRLYRWARPTATIGRFQDPGSIDLARCAALGVDVARRFTGGRGVLHDDELTYAVIARRSDGVPAGIAASYAFLSRGLAETYAALGVEATLTSRDRGVRGSAACYLHSTQADLSVGLRKLSGSAQVWHRDTVLQHGSVVLSRDVETEAAVFRLDAEHEALLRAKATSLQEMLGASPDVTAVCEAAIRGFAAGLEIALEEGSLTRHETELADELEESVVVPGSE